VFILLLRGKHAEHSSKHHSLQRGQHRDVC